MKNSIGIFTPPPAYTHLKQAERMCRTLLFGLALLFGFVSAPAWGQSRATEQAGNASGSQLTTGNYGADIIHYTDFNRPHTWISPGQEPGWMLTGIPGGTKVFFSKSILNGSPEDNRSYAFNKEGIELEKGKTYRITVACSVATPSKSYRSLKLGLGHLEEPSREKAKERVVLNSGLLNQSGWRYFSATFVYGENLLCEKPTLVLWADYEKPNTDNEDLIHASMESATGIFVNHIRLVAADKKPRLAIVKPAMGAELPSCDIRMEATNLNPAFPFEKVDFYRNGQWIGMDTEAPYQLASRDWEPGTYWIRATGTGESGEMESDSVKISVREEKPLNLNLREYNPDCAGYFLAGKLGPEQVLVIHLIEKRTEENGSPWPPEMIEKFASEDDSVEWKLPVYFSEYNKPAKLYYSLMNRAGCMRTDSMVLFPQKGRPETGPLEAVSGFRYDEANQIYSLCDNAANGVLKGSGGSFFEILQTPQGPVLETTADTLIPIKPEWIAQGYLYVRAGSHTGCEAKDFAIFKWLVNPSPTVWADTLISYGGQPAIGKAYASGGTEPYTFTWTGVDTCFTQNCDSIKISLPADFILVEAVDQLGCKNQVSLTVISQNIESKLGTVNNFALAAKNQISLSRSIVYGKVYGDSIIGVEPIDSILFGLENSPFPQIEIFVKELKKKSYFLKIDSLFGGLGAGFYMVQTQNFLRSPTIINKEHSNPLIIIFNGDLEIDSGFYMEVANGGYKNIYFIINGSLIIRKNSILAGNFLFSHNSIVQSISNMAGIENNFISENYIYRAKNTQECNLSGHMNLICNSGFENLISVNSFSINNATSWTNGTRIYFFDSNPNFTSSDIFIQNSSNPSYSIPDNSSGIEPTRSINNLNYAGLISRVVRPSSSLNGLGELNESLQQKFSNPLSAGAYIGEFYFSKGERAILNPGGLGMYFSETPPQPICPNSVTDLPQFKCGQQITGPNLAASHAIMQKIISENPCSLKTIIPHVKASQLDLNNYSGWRRALNYFELEGGEKFVTIGNFEPRCFDNSITQPPSNLPGATNHNSYFYIDDVALYPFPKAHSASTLVSNCGPVQLGIAAPEVINYPLVYTWFKGTVTQASEETTPIGNMLHLEVFENGVYSLKVTSPAVGAQPPVIEYSQVTVSGLPDYGLTITTLPSAPTGEMLEICSDRTFRIWTETTYPLANNILLWMDPLPTGVSGDPIPTQSNPIYDPSLFPFSYANNSGADQILRFKFQVVGPNGCRGPIQTMEVKLNSPQDPVNLVPVCSPSDPANFAIQFSAGSAFVVNTMEIRSANFSLDLEGNEVLSSELTVDGNYTAKILSDAYSTTCPALAQFTILGNQTIPPFGTASQMTLDKPTFVKGNIEIPSGKTLKFRQNTTAFISGNPVFQEQFAGGSVDASSIKIKSGAILELESGVKLEGICGNMWKGIELEIPTSGTAFASFISNGAEIFDAYKAISTSSSISSNFLLKPFLNIQNSDFINCYFGLDICAPKPTSNLLNNSFNSNYLEIKAPFDYLRNKRFVRTGKIVTDGLFLTHTGIRISEPFDLPIAQFKNNTFEDMAFGVMADFPETGTLPGVESVIGENTFSNCHLAAIYVRGLGKVKAFDNEISLPTTSKLIHKSSFQMDYLGQLFLENPSYNPMLLRPIYTYGIYQHDNSSIAGRSLDLESATKWILSPANPNLAYRFHAGVGFRSGIGNDVTIKGLKIKDLDDGVLYLQESGNSVLNISGNTLQDNFRAISLRRNSISGLSTLDFTLKCNQFKLTCAEQSATACDNQPLRKGLVIGEGVRVTCSDQLGTYPNEIGGQDGLTSGNQYPNANEWPVQFGTNRAVFPSAHPDLQFNWNKPNNWSSLENGSTNPTTNPTVIYRRYKNEFVWSILDENPTFQTSPTSSMVKTEGTTPQPGITYEDACNNLITDVYPIFPARIAVVTDSTQSITSVSSKRDIGSWLGSASPNPAGKTTLVECFIPEKEELAVLQFVEISTGKVLNSKTLKERGKLRIEIDLSQFAAGVYGYQVILEKEKLGAKRFVVIK
jgi:hypothetical protein